MYFLQSLSDLVVVKDVQNCRLSSRVPYNSMIQNYGYLLSMSERSSECSILSQCPQITLLKNETAGKKRPCCSRQKKKNHLGWRFKSSVPLLHRSIRLCFFFFCAKPSHDAEALSPDPSLGFRGGYQKKLDCKVGEPGVKPSLS